MFTPLLFILPGFIAVCGAALPPWLKPCKIGADFDECSMKSGIHAVPFLMKGDPKHKVPSFNPLIVPELQVTDEGHKSVALNITFKNLKIYGLDQAKLVKSASDFQKHHLEFTLNDMDVSVFGDYAISGKFLVLPITGSGPCNFTIENLSIVLTIEYKLETKKGVEYLVVTDVHIKHTTSKIRIKFENLFNGDKALGQNMNDFMNENWMAINEAILPSVLKAISLYVKQVMTTISTNVPYNMIFLN